MVEDARLLRFWLWFATNVEFNDDADPYVVVVPYSTWVVADSLVVQMMVAALYVMLLLLTLEIVGAVVSGAADVVKVLSADMAEFPAPSVLFTR